MFKSLLGANAVHEPIDPAFLGVKLQYSPGQLGQHRQEALQDFGLPSLLLVSETIKTLGFPGVSGPIIDTFAGSEKGHRLLESN